jgi:hypothetical protein
MKIKRADCLLILLIISAMGCKKPYTPPAVNKPNNYLVVEGVINSGSDLTTIKLSRTVNIDSSVTSNPVLHATVTVEGDQNNTYTLTEGSTGYYYFTGLNLDNSHKYRLRIKTSDNNREYLSDFAPVKNTPPIDSVGFTLQSNGIQIYVNTHDAANNTRYYRWDYEETWQFHAKYFSSYVSDGRSLNYRRPDQLIYSCFGDNISSTIVLGSSAKLTQDVIYQSPIVAIASTSEKIETKYSILLHQYALTPEAYKFWENLKKNTEQLGSIFDAQPSQINGNIHNINDPSEPVVGYISVGLVQSKRVFITNDQLPQAWQPVYPYDNCQEDTAYFDNPRTHTDDTRKLIPLPPVAVPTSQFYVRGSAFPAGFLFADAECVDCTIRGFTAAPSFWK